MAATRYDTRLGTWTTRSVRRRLQLAALAWGKPQCEILNTALERYLPPTAELAELAAVAGDPDAAA
jgi:hypothetical protein